MRLDDDIVSKLRKEARGATVLFLTVCGIAICLLVWIVDQYT